MQLAQLAMRTAHMRPQNVVVAVQQQAVRRHSLTAADLAGKIGHGDALPEVAEHAELGGLRVSVKKHCEGKHTSSSWQAQ